MAYRRRHGLSRSSTFKEEIHRSPDDDDTTTTSAALPHRGSDSRLDAFRSPSGAFHSSFKSRSKLEKQASASLDFTSMKGTTEPRGFWGVLARKAKAILDDEVPQQLNASSSSSKPETIHFSTSNQFTGIQAQKKFESSENLRKMDSPAIKIGLERLKSSLNQLDTIGNALETDKKIQRGRATVNEEKDQIRWEDLRIQSAQPQRNQETQLKASRDVAIATAAKVKQLAQELKTLKAELAFAKERCCQLEEENKMLRDAPEEGDYPADDDMIRVQLETLLAEKGRLAHENSVYARENRYLREIVEFHQLNMQDVVYLDECIKEAAQVNLLPTETSQFLVEASLPSTRRRSL